MYNPAQDVAERFFANFLNKDHIENFRSGSITSLEIEEIDDSKKMLGLSTESSLND